MESYLIGQSQLMLAISLTAGTQQFPAALLPYFRVVRQAGVVPAGGGFQRNRGCGADRQRHAPAFPPKEPLHKHNKVLCNTLNFHPCISPFIPIDFPLLFRYCVTRETYTKYRNQEEMQMTSTKKRIAAALTAAILTSVVPGVALVRADLRGVHQSLIDRQL